MSLPHPEENPWTLKSKAEKYDNPWINVNEHQVIDPGGQPGIYGVVHVKNLAIGIIPVDDEGNTYLVGQYRYPLKVYSWEIIEGGGALELDPVLSARRELKEEAGLSAAQYTEIQRLYTSNSITDEIGIIYLATGLTVGEAEPDSTEDLTIRKLPLVDAFAYTYDGTIKDSLAVAGLQKLELMLRRGDVQLSGVRI
ncbi:MAG: NUDIX domain-containing protein [Bacteroidota bacterium]